jgi:hypothetical protein
MRAENGARVDKAVDKARARDLSGSSGSAWLGVGGAALGLIYVPPEVDEG